MIEFEYVLHFRMNEVRNMIKIIKIIKEEGIYEYN